MTDGADKLLALYGEGEKAKIIYSQDITNDNGTDQDPNSTAQGTAQAPNSTTQKALDNKEYFIRESKPVTVPDYRMGDFVEKQQLVCRPATAGEARIGSRCWRPCMTSPTAAGG